MTQVLGQTSAMLADVVHLEIVADSPYLESIGQLEDTISNIAWLELLRPFTAVKTLRVPTVLAASFALALEGITGEMGIQLLPCVS